jgi:hypothetical protein
MERRRKHAAARFLNRARAIVEGMRRVHMAES